jgi:hypothetical protein
MPIKPLIALLLSSFLISCSASTTYEQRLTAVMPVFVEQLDEIDQQLRSTKTEYHQSQFSADAKYLLDSIAAKISAEIAVARFQLAEAQAELDSDRLRKAVDSITELRAEVTEFELLAMYNPVESSPAR